MVLFIISIGLSIMMGLMRVVNLAHGAFAMIGGYLASYAMRDLGMNYALAIVAAVIGTIIISIRSRFCSIAAFIGSPTLSRSC